MKLNSFYKGILYTCLASLFWGVPQPLFFNEIKFIPALEVAIHRGIWSFIILLILLFFLGKINNFIILFKSNKKILILSLTAILITINWTGFIFAVTINRVQDASMGYYITPLISIGLGYFFLKEEISKLKIISILLMLSSILFLIISLKTIPFLAILIGTSWGIYGLLRKQINVSSEIGLLYESGFISLLGIPYLFYLHLTKSGFFLSEIPLTSAYLMLTGIITLLPLYFFNKGVKFIPLGFAGVIFFLTPTFHFLTSVFILGENINTSKLISFIIIWISIIIYILDILKNKKIYLE